MYNCIICTEDRVKLTNGTPSFIFQILAVPSVDDETKNSESKLQERRQQPNISPCCLLNKV